MKALCTCGSHEKKGNFTGQEKAQICYFFLKSFLYSYKKKSFLYYNIINYSF